MNKNTKSESSEDSWKELAKANKSRDSKASETVQRMISRMNEIKPFASATGILDNGCGPGGIISHIIETHGPEIPTSATVIAGDFSQGMLDVVNEKKASRSSGSGDVWDRLEVRKLDAHDLTGVPDDSISHVTGGHLYFLLPNPRKALLATYRVLETGGVLALTSGKDAQHIHALCNAVEHIRPGTNLQLLSEPWKSEAGVKGELEATGFTNVETFVIETEMGYETYRGMAEMLMVMPVMKDATQGFSKDERSQVLEHVVDGLRAANPKEPGSLRGASIVALARKAA